MSWWSFKPYVSVAQRRADAAKEVAKLAKKRRKVCPVTLEGRTIAATFWGKAWCDNLESYSDFENRLPRGRSYVRNGSVVDLQIEPGTITALMSGSDLYRVKIGIRPLAAKTWAGIQSRCAGKIASLIELLQGKLSGGVMGIVTGPSTGLFPPPAEIEMECSCPDGAYMCKHVAAVLYGVGARLDHQPELLFTLRQVNHLDLVAQAGNLQTLTEGSSNQKTIAAGELEDVFGIELNVAASAAAHPIKRFKPTVSKQSPVTPQKIKPGTCNSKPRAVKAVASKTRQPRGVQARAGRKTKRHTIQHRDAGWHRGIDC